MSTLPSRFLQITASKNQLVKRLERLRTSKYAGQEEGHVLVQGIKTLEELASKGHHHIRTIGITFDEHNLPIRSPALDIVTSVQQQDADGVSTQALEQGLRKQQGQQRRDGKLVFEADQFVAMSPKLTTRILGTDSPTAEHEVWAEVAIPDFKSLFSKHIMGSNSRSGSKTAPSKLSTEPQPEIRRLLVLDQISDPGNMGLIIRSAMALSWDGAWHTPGTVDPYNNKVVRASRALCLDWPTKTGRWKELERLLQTNDMTLLVADMLPRWILDRSTKVRAEGGAPAPAPAAGLATAVQDLGEIINPYNLVWWNWPGSLSRSHVPEKIALVMSSEHHGVKAAVRMSGEDDQEERDAKARLLHEAIRVSIPMNPAVESMNVAAAGTAMMWELNRVLDEGKRATAKLQIFDTPE
ncbi:hypothetical protein BGZ54_000280 [Gamsiella multidivaricata]|nr:hypothetical protein BGZ54_000280 [Gamsiella multidivaricata]